MVGAQIHTDQSERAFVSGPADDANALAAQAERAGLLDVAAERIRERHELVRFLSGQGCSIDEMRDAVAAGRLFGLAADRIIRPGGRQFTLEETADVVGVPVDVLRRIWTALGFPSPPAGVPVVSIDERAALVGVGRLLDQVGEVAVIDISASIAIGLGAIAEAASAVARSTPDMSVARTHSELLTAKAAAANAEFAPWLGRLTDLMLRRHLLAARSRFEATVSYETVEDQQLVLAVAFVDVSGYTAATEAMTAVDLCDLIRQFERVAIDAAQSGGGRVAKFVGDAAMIVAATPDELASVVTSLIPNWDAVSPSSIGVRAGLAFGPVTSRQGDYFGSPVNLAARLVAIAPCGSILAADALADRLTHDWLLGDAQSLDIRGFAHPVLARTIAAKR